MPTSSPGPAWHVVRPMDVYEEPSTRWGWHGVFPRGTQLAGWGTVVVLLLMIFTLQRGTSDWPDVWMGGIALVMAILLIRDLVRRNRLNKL
ncbi:Protein of unknown function (DUF2631) [Streptoalloteichus tenebrarius]|uniref:DUF2631 domain-containing protein n=1 Tax=Streptoalloteichus tenebrarius (strain ATCC 17920 / DSM 40477 / JCM 4838 / CBS 697.72 / NBRC 16177 / NCIMB 11028 / NRRL B-12390 / A12253. 1 / ISP 5477) TaxID=1933 RepID=A0ABT1HQ52_STRSD|nr:DUF2631 domain-containing protein [Streptoalloteichus tenebrarius]MCP2257637.1 Protein of unknown function (DUF2631) [Streptoalloteichus tenebrarius]BFE98597.1 DUF2631 domain-containing protein [Streptoalloteichus tenebrarius]